MVEDDDDLLEFFDADDFAHAAAIVGVDGTVPVLIDTYHDTQRPGGTSNSTMGSFMVGAADMNIQPIQATAPWFRVSEVSPETTLEFASGPYAGRYRIKDIQRDGEIARLMLTKR